MAAPALDLLTDIYYTSSARIHKYDAGRSRVNEVRGIEKSEV